MELLREQNLDITWVNHSYQHPYNPQILDLKQNFSNLKGFNFEEDLLKNEEKLLQEGLIPSIFFRFPGLIASKSHLQKLRALGLIPLAADAWLAKGEKQKLGSIILVHGNSNEHSGIILAQDLLDKEEFLPIINHNLLQFR